ncbi:phage holin family protein [Corynebacterium variabile]|nr:phage holin family protein [Corynebacterium variabile]
MKFLTRFAVSLASSAVAILLCALFIDRFTLSFGGIVVAVIVFTVAQLVLAPVVTKLVGRYAEGFVGGAGLVSTLLALWIATLPSGGLVIHGAGTWVVATVLMWALTAATTLIIAAVLRKRSQTPAA